MKRLQVCHPYGLLLTCAKGSFGPDLPCLHGRKDTAFSMSVMVTLEQRKDRDVEQWKDRAGPRLSGSCYYIHHQEEDGSD